MAQIKEYVLGFAFDEKSEKVVLILKDRPDWQKGLYNGVGGKVEKNDFDRCNANLNHIYSAASAKYFAMEREFLEESGVLIPFDKWNYFALMEFEDDVMGGTALVHCFTIKSDLIENCKTQESEMISIKLVEDVFAPRNFKHMVFNLPSMVGLALNTGLKFATLAF